jgi:hypothetical protein
MGATKVRSIEHFIALCGNLPMDKITRDHAQRFYEWWGDRIQPKVSDTSAKAKV